MSDGDQGCLVSDTGPQSSLALASEFLGVPFDQLTKVTFPLFLFYLFIFNSFTLLNFDNITEKLFV